MNAQDPPSLGVQRLPSLLLVAADCIPSRISRQFPAASVSRKDMCSAAHPEIGAHVGPFKPAVCTAVWGAPEGVGMCGRERLPPCSPPTPSSMWGLDLKNKSVLPKAVSR